MRCFFLNTFLSPSVPGKCRNIPFGLILHLLCLCFSSLGNEFMQKSETSQHSIWISSLWFMLLIWFLHSGSSSKFINLKIFLKTRKTNIPERVKLHITGFNSFLIKIQMDLTSFTPRRLLLQLLGFDYFLHYEEADSLGPLLIFSSVCWGILENLWFFMG